MVIDAHVHLFFQGSDPDEFFLGSARSGAASFGRKTGVLMDAQQLYENAFTILSDKTGEKLLKKMKRARIDRAVLLPLDFWGIIPGSENREGSMKIEEKNELYHSIVAEYPGVLATMVGVDPRRKNSVDILHSMFKKDPVPVGLKIHPTAGFYPDDKECYPLYKAALEYDLPVLIHSGNEPAPMQAKYSQPKYIDTVAADFPELRIIIAHCGHGWWQEAIDLASMKPNICVDFSGWQAEYTQGPDYFWEALRRAMDVLGPWRVFFGTDGSMVDLILEPSKWIQAIRDRKSPMGITFSDDEIEVFLHKAAAKFFKF